MITAIRIQNLRSLRDTGFVDLKKITVLLGANSSGKSTFLRSFPLFSQSVAKNLREPISWFDDSMVDFGDFQTAKCKYADKNEDIVITFKLTEPYEDGFHYWGRNVFIGNETKLDGEYIFSISYSIRGKDKETYVKMIEVERNNIKVSFCIDEKDDHIVFFINGKNVLIDNVNAKWSIFSKMLPFFYSPNLNGGASLTDPSSEIYEQIAAFFLEMTGNRLQKKNRLSSFFNISNTKKEKLLATIKNSRIKSIAKRANAWNAYTPEFVDIYNKIVLYQITKRLQSFENELVTFYMRCGYIAPMRAEANRYYRNQGLQVNDIDSYGRNLQEFIASLSQSARKSFQDFVKGVLGVFVYVKKPMGQHLSIFINNGVDDFNMADTGFGYSQILPILTKIWYASYSPKTSRYRYHQHDFKKVAIEQPELHLHPALQAKIADTFVNVVNKNDTDNVLSFLVETHSPTIINRLGKRVREGKISKDDINIVIFSKDNVKHETKVNQISFNDKGIIEKWPFGFFDPSDD